MIGSRIPILASTPTHGNGPPAGLEPITVGIPLPRGWCSDAAALRLTRAGADSPQPLQTRTLEQWPDGSLRWVLLDFQADAALEWSLENAPDTLRPSHAAQVCVTAATDRYEIDTGVSRFGVGRSSLPFCVLSDTSADTHPVAITAILHDDRGRPALLDIHQVAIEESGPLRAVFLVTGEWDCAGRRLDVLVRVHFYAGLSTVRTDFSIRNSSPARHPGGIWELGDPGSVLFRHVAVRVQASRISRIQCSLSLEDPLVDVTPPFELYQESSGGEQWQSPVHLNRDGVVPHQRRGYITSSGRSGLRATPLVHIEAEGRGISASVLEFWQTFPKAFSVRDDGLELALFPSAYPDVFELQGGEQKTHTLFLAFGHQPGAPSPLEWTRRPRVARTTWAQYVAAQAIPHAGAAVSGDSTYEALVGAAVDPFHGFVAKREMQDEYGWRHFGDIPADHEAVFARTPPPIISHYNNQYDVLAGCLLQFMRTGDRAWWDVAQPLAKHVADIDSYHTTNDKSAYNGGMFWHTAHYVSAGLSTHRSFPRSPGVSGGGPSSEHDYTSGLMLHHLMTGDPLSRETVLTIAQWVIDMDEGSKTVFRWLTRAPTGLASATRSLDYHGPGRGAGHSIATLLNAWRLTGAREYLDTAERLIRRCVHPDDDIDARGLLDAENRWSYVIFLQILGRYVEEKTLAAHDDGILVYARQSLLSYARWMATHEYPYLDKPELLEYPTETWAAQEIRKADVFAVAASHAPDATDRTRFAERARYFRRTALAQLSDCDTRTFTRPLAILLSNGYVGVDEVAVGAPAQPFDIGAPERFLPQRRIAERRAVIGAAAVALASLLASALWIRACLL